MKVTFYSNFLNHHQLPFCESMLNLIGDNFKFVATEKIPEERIKLGYEDMNSLYSFVLRAYENIQEAIDLCRESDVIILGSAPNIYVKEAIKYHKLVFRYSERLYKNDNFLKKMFSVIKMFLRNNFFEKNVYLLCASAFTSYDYYLSRSYNGKYLKWGYFPKVKKYKSISDVIDDKDSDSILWVGRFLDWKHPEIPVKLMKFLVDNNYKFKLTMIGDGPLFEYIREMIVDYNLSNYIELKESMSPEKIREYMEKSKYYLFTSDKGEGWGAVLNEAMNSACVVFANSKIGAAPYLINDGYNGIIYKDTDDLFFKFKNIINSSTTDISKNAYYTFIKVWNSEVAAKRFLTISQKILDGENALNLYNDGPCSFAHVMKDDWFK